MAKMHSRAKGKSGSTRPATKTKRSWIRYSAKEAEQLVIKLANAEKSQSQIGITLRDVYGIPSVMLITKKSISQIIEDNRLKKELPEDLVALIKKDIQIMKHMEGNKKDMPSKRGLQLTKSKINRLTKYYKRTGVLPSDWAYDRDRAKILIG